MEKKLPIGIQDFEVLIEGGYLYVDKTELIWQLIDRGKYYFLSRPRRFGKSLLVSTLKAVFEGRKDLFKGLWIEDKLDWEPFPVIVIDFSELHSPNRDLVTSLHNELDRIAGNFNLQLESEDIDQKFRELIEVIGKDGKVAILIDEYDKPIIDFIDNPEKAARNRDVLRDFYSVVKGNDRHIAFFLVTGISKFSHVSIFSDLNNLYDISVGFEFAELLGYNQVELDRYFGSRIEKLALRYQRPKPELYQAIKTWYNGYSWDGSQFVYNPFSILNFLRKQAFQGFWYATGTPRFLTRLVREQNFPLFDLDTWQMSLAALGNFEVGALEVETLLFQTGYLTISEYDYENNFVTLKFPNREVEQGFFQNLLDTYASGTQNQPHSLLNKLSTALSAGEPDALIESMKVLFAHITYPIAPSASTGIEQQEKYYHTIFALIIKLLGFQIETEILTHTGRIDALIRTDHYLYIIEFKLGDADEAMTQILEKNYPLKYRETEKKVILLGIGFDVEVRNIGGYRADFQLYD